MGNVSTILRRRRRKAKDEFVLRSSGSLSIHGSNNLASVFSRRGQKGPNQDRCIVWEEFGGEEDMMFCGIFDGHGPWGHFVAKKVRDSMPCALLRNWQHALLEASDKKQKLHHIWNHSYLNTCAAIDQELRHHRTVDSFYSGTTALTIVRQGDAIFIANVGDCRAVLGTSSQSGNLVAEQLTIDMKPNLPQEAARISECNGRVYSLQDEAGVPRLWLPDEESPGLAMSRAFGDYCAKDFGLTSVPHLTHRDITSNDHFVVIATDGVWDVISNEEAVEIVAAADEREKCGKRLVECAARAWKRKRKGIAMDDISAIVIFFHSHTFST
ncbi:probable protein phosphatase 2C 34 [Salvia miltiorrhiza]|uniref:probable protein phosphatase 2C 34 n=1 Tax=Salvia miltiorrhiza TaxID=226208 RepID=UPI0025AB6B54|nr:probable protein phosphatase 2C 34 [Salvia miltiorrhiza]XP_057792164.1 probable protein phosphatase 2C 34 [Salvia miltiorrhiza]